MVRRGPKIALSVAILAVGIGTAMLFRKSPSEDSIADTTPDSSLVLREDSPAAASPAPVAAFLSGSIETPDLQGDDEPPEENLLSQADSSSNSSSSSAEKTDVPAWSLPLKVEAARPAAPPLPSGSDASIAKADGGPFQIVPPLTKPKAPALVVPPIAAPPVATGALSNSNSPARTETSPHVAAYPAGTTAATKKHKIADGDTLASIAMQYFGTASGAQQIYEANRAILTNPDLLPIGKEILLPLQLAVPAQQQESTAAASSPTGDLPLVPVQSFQPSQPTTYTRPPTKSHRVQAGETLVEVSRRVYGDGRYHEAIFNANRNQLRHPGDIRPGMTLQIP